MMKYFRVLLLPVLLFSFGCSDDDAAETYTVTYHANGADSGSVPVDSGAYAVGANVTVLSNSGNLVKTGSTFAGWNSVADGSGTNLAAGATFEMPASNVTLYAKWAVDQHTVTFDKNDDAATGSMSAQTINSGASASLTANGFSKTGYSFTGWATTPTGDTAYTNQQSYTMGTSNVTLYAKWSVNQYTVSFDSQSGSSVTSQTVTYGGKVTEPAAPSRSGYQFKGWFKDANHAAVWNFGTDSVTGSTTIYACWKSDALSIPLGQDLVSVPGGIFTQQEYWGASFFHTVSAFSIGKYEVTYELWYTVYSWATNNGYAFANAGTEGNDGSAGAAPTTDKYEPVSTINWRDAMVWCNAYSQMSGLTPVYYTDEGFASPIRNSTDGDYSDSVNPNPGGNDNPYVRWDAKGYRLPTEGEWQYAARYKDGSEWTPIDYASGSTNVYSDATASGVVAWFDANTGFPRSTKQVGSKSANQLGIHDMCGNVNEWLWDWKNPYPSTAQSDYRGGSASGFRMQSSGEYDGEAFLLQIGYRAPLIPYMENYPTGLRVARYGF